MEENVSQAAEHLVSIFAAGEAKKWTMPIRDWKQAMSQFMILFGNRTAL